LRTTILRAAIFGTQPHETTNPRRAHPGIKEEIMELEKRRDSSPLPRIIGVTHNQKTFDSVRQLIDSLPAGSKVALESHVPDSYSPAFKKAFPKVSAYFGTPLPVPAYFRDLARHAEARGHTVVWLDRPILTVPEFLTEVRKLEKELPTLASGRQRFEAIQKMKMNLKSRDWRTFLSARRRSVQFTRTIFRNEWKPTDIAIMGHAHAVHLSQMLGLPIEQHFFEDRHYGPSQKLSLRHWLHLNGAVALADIITGTFMATRRIRKYVRSRTERKKNG